MGTSLIDLLLEKKSIQLDLKSKQGKEIALKLRIRMPMF